MKLFSLLGNSQQLDGGAMFGNAPKAVWAKWMNPDSQNRITLACRCLLIQVSGKNILLETGIGAFFEPKLKARYGVVESEHILLSSLANIGLTDKDIDFIVLSHLHFDHAGGLLSPWQSQQPPSLLFPRARIIVSEAAFERALNPHQRDRASFIPALNEMLVASKQLEIYKDQHSLGSFFSFHISNGHTPGMLLTEIKTPKGPLLFAADLIPGVPWIHLPITMGYDRFPEKVIDEKEKILKYLAKTKGWLFFTHDPHVSCAKIICNTDNKFMPAELFPFIDGEI